MRRPICPAPWRPWRGRRGWNLGTDAITLGHIESIQYSVPGGIGVADRHRNPLGSAHALPVAGRNTSADPCDPHDSRNGSGSHGGGDKADSDGKHRGG